MPFDHRRRTAEPQVHARLERLDPAAQRRDLATRFAEGQQRLPVALGEVAELGQQLAEGARLEAELFVGRRLDGHGGTRLQKDAQLAIVLLRAQNDAASNELPNASLRNSEDLSSLWDRVAIHGFDSVAPCDADGTRCRVFDPGLLQRAAARPLSHVVAETSVRPRLTCWLCTW